MSLFSELWVCSLKEIYLISLLPLVLQSLPSGSLIPKFRLCLVTICCENNYWPGVQTWPHPFEQHFWSFGHSPSALQLSTQIPPISVETTGQTPVFTSVGQRQFMIVLNMYNKDEDKSLWLVQTSPDQFLNCNTSSDWFKPVSQMQYEINWLNSVFSFLK